MGRNLNWHLTPKDRGRADKHMKRGFTSQVTWTMRIQTANPDQCTLVRRGNIQNADNTGCRLRAGWEWVVAGTSLRGEQMQTGQTLGESVWWLPPDDPAFTLPDMYHTY